MHTALLATIVWSAVWAALPVKLIMIAGSAYVIISTLKKIFSSLSGWYAMALNVALNVCGAIAVAHPGDFSNPNFYAGLMLTIASASGIQGIVKQSALSGAAAPTQAQLDADAAAVAGALLGTAVPVSGQPAKAVTTSNVAAKALVAFLTIGIMFPVSGCRIAAATPPTAPTALPTGAVDQVDADANKALRPAHDFAASFSADVQSGKVTLTASQKLALTSLNRALNVADKAEQTYHNGGGGTATALNAAVSAALSAWSSAEDALAQLSGK